MYVVFPCNSLLPPRRKDNNSFANEYMCEILQQQIKVPWKLPKHLLLLFQLPQSLRSEPFPEDNSCNPSTSPVQSSLAVQLRYPEKSEMVNLQTVHRTCLDRYAEEEHLVDLADR